MTSSGGDGGSGHAAVGAAIASVASGRPVVVLDEAQGRSYLAMAAQFARAADVNFMATHARGLIQVALSAERAQRLGLAPMVEHGGEDDALVSVEARRGVTTGISARDRARTARVLADPASRPPDLVQPGHTFPVRVHEHGTLGRARAAEAAADLCRIAGVEAAALLCEVLQDDGDVAGAGPAGAFAARHRLPLVRVADVVAYRLAHEPLVERVGHTSLPTPIGTFTAIGYRSRLSEREHLALVAGATGEPAGGAGDGEPVPCRVHRHCATGNVFGSLDCCCEQVLTAALRELAQRGRGVVVYLRGDPADGPWCPDARAFGQPETGLAAQILLDLGVRRVRLLGGGGQSPALDRFGVQIAEQVDLLAASPAASAAVFDPAAGRPAAPPVAPETPDAPPAECAGGA